MSSTERVFTRKGSFVCSSNAHIHRRRAGQAFVECWLAYPVCHFVPAKVGKWRTACYMRLTRCKCGTASSRGRWDEAWKTGANRGNNQLHSFSETECTNDLCCWDLALNKFASVTFAEIITYMHMCTCELGVLLSPLYVCQNDIWHMPNVISTITDFMHSSILLILAIMYVHLNSHNDCYCTILLIHLQWKLLFVWASVDPDTM